MLLRRIGFFYGKSFFEAVSDNETPSRQELLGGVCLLTQRADDLKYALFPVNGEDPLSLVEAAHVISIVLLNENKTLHEEVANILSCQVSQLIGNSKNSLT
jgi:hypothetical protein